MLFHHYSSFTNNYKEKLMKKRSFLFDSFNQQQKLFTLEIDLVCLSYRNIKNFHVFCIKLYFYNILLIFN
jgi:hypothetical protein